MYSVIAKGVLCYFVCLFHLGQPHGGHDDGDFHTVAHDRIPVQICDDGKTGIDIDLDGEKDWKCLEKSTWSPNQWYLEDKKCYERERAYHVCIDKNINALYKASIPHSGPHRKVWAQYGEYRYLPPGRYVHNLEHDAVVFMYHPCAPRDMVDELRRTATTCLTRHIITAFANLTEQFPFAVVTYGCIFQMSLVNSAAIKGWVRSRFGKSPEPDVYGNGHYNFGLLNPAPERTSYDYDDTSSPFCPDDAGTGVTSISSKGNVEPETIRASSTTSSYFESDATNSEFDTYHIGTTREAEDIANTEPSEISTEYELLRDNSSSYAPNVIMTKVAKGSPIITSALPRASATKDAVTVGIRTSVKPNSPITNEVFESDKIEDVITTVQDRLSDDSEQSLSDSLPSSTAVSGAPFVSDIVKTDADQNNDNSSFLFVVILAILLYTVGVGFGCLLHWCYRRNRFRNFPESKIWRDNDATGSFNIAAVVRKMPRLPRKGDSYDKYEMLRDNFSDDDNFA